MQLLVQPWQHRVGQREFQKKGWVTSFKFYKEKVVRSYYLFSLIKFRTQWVELVDGGSVFNVATPSSFNSDLYIVFVIFQSINPVQMS